MTELKSLNLYVLPELTGDVSSFSGLIGLLELTVRCLPKLTGGLSILSHMHELQRLSMRFTAVGGQLPKAEVWPENLNDFVVANCHLHGVVSPLPSHVAMFGAAS